METNGIRELNEPSAVPTLYVGSIEDLLGRVPFFPCFLDGNTTSTIPHKYAPRQKQAFEYGCADGSGQGSRRGSHVYEINSWLWNFGRPQPRIGGLSVAKPKGYADSPGLKRPGAVQRPKRPGSVLLTRYDKHIPGIYLSYVPTQ